MKKGIFKLVAMNNNPAGSFPELCRMCLKMVYLQAARREHLSVGCLPPLVQIYQRGDYFLTHLGCAGGE